MAVETIIRKTIGLYCNWRTNNGYGDFIGSHILSPVQIPASIIIEIGIPSVILHANISVKTVNTSTRHLLK